MNQISFPKTPSNQSPRLVVLSPNTSIVFHSFTFMLLLSYLKKILVFRIYLGLFSFSVLAEIQRRAILFSIQMESWTWKSGFQFPRMPWQGLDLSFHLNVKTEYIKQWFSEFGQETAQGNIPERSKITRSALLSP